MKRVALTFHDGHNIESYVDAVRDSGLEPLLVTPSRPLESVSAADGLLLAGGPDVGPSLYGHEPDPRTQTPIPERDALEQRLLREALDIDLPVLAICRGMQLFNVTHPGGTLFQHIEGHRIITPDRGDPAHDVGVLAGTRLAAIMGAGYHPVNSRHHQAVSSIGAGLVISARSKTDAVIEGLERPDRRFAVAVQWHPENQVRRLPAQRALFDAFGDAL